MSEPLILHCRLSPGDVTMLTAAVEALHSRYPGRYVTDVRTPCPDLWLHNPYITPLADDTPGVRHIECHYPLIQDSNRRPCHFVQGYARHLGSVLGVDLDAVAFRGDIHLSEEERSATPLVHLLTADDSPYWIVCAGGKYDFTIKWWHPRRWQQVVDSLQGRVRFVQVGEKGHCHPRLERVIDLRGQTSLRDLVLLVHHAAGVLCPVTSLMHLAAAVPSPGGAGERLRPCVVVAGAREAANWEAYPGHQFLHTVGTLSCCARGGCWRSRTRPLGDRQEHDAPARVCLRPMPSGLPECMDMIESHHVTAAIEWYLRAVPPAPTHPFQLNTHE